MEVALRRAASSDEARLLEWRNDPRTREQAFQSHPIPPSEHRRWFADKQSDPLCVILIVEADGRPVGQVRLERVDDRTAEVHIGLAPDAQGQGVGRMALRMAITQAPGLLDVPTLLARIKPDNRTSLNAFRAAGFVDQGITSGALQLVACSESGG
jgi:UDP-2,4-diacetamido-2,4,6-trideoxy-beta-L-altropyranose hydrolase